MSEPIVESGVSLDILREYLTDHTTPEHVQLFVRGFDVLRDFGVDEYESVFESILMLGDSGDHDASETLVRLTDQLQLLMGSVIREHGIVLDDTLPLHEVIGFNEALFGVDKHDLVSDALQTLESDEDDIGKLARLLAITGDKDEAFYASMIWEVPSELLDRLYLGFKSIEEQTQAGLSPDELRDYYDRYRSYLSFLNTTNTRVNRLLGTGLAVGLEFSSYIDRFGTMFGPMAEANVAVELYGFQLLSSEHNKNPIEVIEREFEGLFENMQRSQTIRRIVVNIMHKYQDWLKSNQHATDSQVLRTT